MESELKQIACDDVCGFLVRSHDEHEIKQIAGEHVKKIHKMKVTEKELDEKIMPAS